MLLPGGMISDTARIRGGGVLGGWGAARGGVMEGWGVSGGWGVTLGVPPATTAAAPAAVGGEVLGR